MRKLLLVLLLWPLFTFLLRYGPAATVIRNESYRIQRIAVAFCLLLILLPIAGGIFTASTERIIFHDEATVLATTAAFRHGQPLYPLPGAPVEYGLLYGPSTYLVYLPPMLLGAERLGSYQLWVVTALALTFLVFYYTLQPQFGAPTAVCAVALLSIFVDFTTWNEWAIKGDPWILFFGALGFFAALRLSRWNAAAIVALAAAMLVDLKITLVFVAFLPMVLLWQRGREYRLPALVSIIAIPLLALAPFALPGISMHGYEAQLMEASKHGFSHRLFGQNLSFAFLLLLPGLGLLWFLKGGDQAAIHRWWRHRAFYLGLLGAATVVAVLTGAKNGAGAWHCMPLVIPLLFVDVELWQAGFAKRGFAQALAIPRSGLLLAIALVFVVTAFSKLALAIHQRHTESQGYVPVSVARLERGMAAIIRQFPNARLQMGYSDMPHYNYTFVRPLLQIHGNPLFIDADTRNEQDLAGVPVSPAVMAALSSCTIDIWILPHGGAPFSMESPYFLDHSVAQQALYPNSFRLAFLRHYQQISSVNPDFDLWRCRRTQAPLDDASGAGAAKLQRTRSQNR